MKLHYQRKSILTISILLLYGMIASVNVQALDVLASWDVNGVDVADGTGIDESVSPYSFTSPNLFSNITDAKLTLGTVNPTTTAGQYGCKVSTTETSLAYAITAGHYIQISITVGSGYKINFSNIAMNGQTSATGWTDAAFMSEIAGYTSDHEFDKVIGINGDTGGLDTDASGWGAPFDLTGEQYQGITGTTTFRIYGWGASSGSATNYIRNLSGDDLVINGTVEAATIIFTDGSAFTPSPVPGNTDQPIGRFALTGDVTGASLTSATITLNGTRTGVTNFKLWASTDNAFGSDTQLGSTVGTDPGTGSTVSFSGLSSGIGTSVGYYFITCDVASDASGTIQGVLVNNSSLSFSVGTLSGTIDNAALSGGDASLPVSLQDFNAIPGNSKVTLCWTTESETENLGFNLYRSVNKNGEFLMLNAELIAGHGSCSEMHEYSYVDRDVVNGVTYYYKLEDVDYAGKAKLHGKVVSATPASKESDANINQFRLYPCYPNPFNPETTLRFELTEAARISVHIYDLLGNRITTLTNAAFQPGEYNLTWNGRDHQNRLVGTGIYFLQISGDRGFSRTEKVIFLR